MPICYILEQWSQTNIIVAPHDSPHNMHHKHTRTMANDGFACASDMVLNSTHNLSIFDHLDLPITKCHKVRPFHA
jgi:hypothetical protein